MVTGYAQHRRATAIVRLGAVFVLAGLAFLASSTTVHEVFRIIVAGIVGGVLVSILSLYLDETVDFDEQLPATLLLFGTGMVIPTIGLLDFTHEGYYLVLTLAALLVVFILLFQTYLTYETAYGPTLGVVVGAILTTLILYGV